MFVGSAEMVEDKHQESGEASAMRESLPYQVLANAVLAFHLALVLFVVLGLVFIVVGNWRRWGWVNSFSFRLIHLVTIAVVAAEAWLGFVCPFTTLEMWLRAKADSTTYAGSFMEHWLQSLLYWEVSSWVFTLAYSLFALAVAAAWWYFPPTFGRSEPSAMRWLKFTRLLWAAPCSAVGLVLALIPLVLGGKAKWSAGALEVTYRQSQASCGKLARTLPFRGIVFGHVILAVTREELQYIGAHERVHVEQYERWGPLFFLAYGASSLWQLLKGRSPYWYNHFEIQARQRRPQ